MLGTRLPVFVAAVRPDLHQTNTAKLASLLLSTKVATMKEAACSSAFEEVLVLRLNLSGIPDASISSVPPQDPGCLCPARGGSACRFGDLIECSLGLAWLHNTLRLGNKSCRHVQETAATAHTMPRGQFKALTRSQGDPLMTRKRPAQRRL